MPRYSLEHVETQNSLNAAFKTGDQAAICSVIYAMIIGNENVSAFALKAGVDRSMLYRSFKHNPGLDLVLKVLRATDFKLVVVEHPKIRKTPSLISKDLNGAFDSEKITQVMKALSKTLRAQDNVVMFAKKANLARGTLYQSFTAPRVPRLSTVLTVISALGFRFSVMRRSSEALNHDQP